jgi:hypothetical protein
MELIAPVRRRLTRWRYVYGWRLRYWWLDTRDGLITRYALAVMALIGVMGYSVYAFVEMLRPVPAGQPKESIIWWIVYLIVVLVIAALAIATMPKPKGPQPTAANTPTTTDGQQVVDAFGTVWTDDSFILAWKQMSTEPIYASGGK